MAFSGFATSTGPVIPSAPLVVSFGGFEELCAFASELHWVVVIADDLRAALVDNLGFRFLGAGAALALGAPNMSLLRW